MRLFHWLSNGLSPSGLKTPADTICAIATPPGAGGVGIIRISGPQAFAFAARLCGDLPPSRQAVLRTIRDLQGETLDHGLLLVFPGPHSFTGEDVAELHMHGGQVLLQLIIQQLSQAGARLARPGEFSERAFLNDKLDLTQAEAIADLIEAGSAAAVRAANRSLDGGLSKPVNQLQQAMLELRVWVEAALDFPEEEIDFLADERIAERLHGLQQQAAQLLADARSGVHLTQGARLAIIGPPNAGKSSLLNALVKHDAAIVTNIPGTTRDVLRERLEIGGIPMEVIDTAGMRESDDPIEQEGIRRAHAALSSADVVLWLDDMTDSSGSAQKPPRDLAVPIIRVGNKSDLLPGPAAQTDYDVVISAKTGTGLELLEQAILAKLNIGNTDTQAFSARPRHVSALQQVNEHLELASGHIPHAGELFAEELLSAQHALSEITGEYHNDDLLGAIFSSFCIGK